MVEEETKYVAAERVVIAGGGTAGRLEAEQIKRRVVSALR